jgi:hypothetical protein
MGGNRMLGLAASTWIVIGTVSGLTGVLLLDYGMPGAVRTGGRPLVVARATPEAIAKERRNMMLGYADAALVACMFVVSPDC